MREYVHWLSFDPFYLPRVSRVLAEGSRYRIARVYNHPSNFGLVVLEVRSPDTYGNLALDIDSGSSPIRHLNHKPTDLGKGLTVEQFESIYGQGTLSRKEEVNP